jgi:hypothetical protein
MRLQATMCASCLTKVASRVSWTATYSQNYCCSSQSASNEISSTYGSASVKTSDLRRKSKRAEIEPHPALYPEIRGRRSVEQLRMVGDSLPAPVSRNSPQNPSSRSTSIKRQKICVYLAVAFSTCLVSRSRRCCRNWCIGPRVESCATTLAARDYALALFMTGTVL